MSTTAMEGVISELAEKIPGWSSQGFIPKKGWEYLAQNGIIGISSGETGNLKKYAGVCQDLAATKNYGLMSALAINEITLKFLCMFPELCGATIIPEIRNGKKNVSLCITEENAGSDLGAIQTEAIPRDGSYVLNGRKVLISNGPIADYFIVAAKTNKQVEPWRGISLYLVGKDAVGLEVAAVVPKAGVHLMPIGEITLNDCMVSESQMLGRKNRGFQYLMQGLGFERIIISILALAQCSIIYKELISYVQSREVFGKKLKDHQNTKFVVAHYFSRMKVANSFVARMIDEYDQTGVIDKTDVTISKITSTELLKDFSAAASQLFGASGYLSKHWVSNLYNDVRFATIAGGANELLLDVLGNNLVHGGS